MRDEITDLRRLVDEAAQECVDAALKEVRERIAALEAKVEEALNDKDGA
jgi:hypothetical protein